jgi:uncharacterized protein (TIGR03437 family)
MAITLRLFALCIGSVTLFAAPPATPPFSWKSVNLQGMGYVSGIIAGTASPYDIYIRTDAGGAYRFDRSDKSWIPLLDSIGTDDVAVGVDSLAVDPSDPNTIYAGVEWVGARSEQTSVEILASHNRGATWNPMNLAPRRLASFPGAPYGGTTGERLAVDPQTPARIYYGSAQDGLWIWTGSQWIQASGGFPATTVNPGTVFVTCHPSGTIYAGVWGDGVWSSDDRGLSWRRILTAPNPARAAIGADGTVFVLLGGSIDPGTGGAIMRLRQGVWTDVTPPGVHDTFSGLTLDPADSQTLVVNLNHEMNIFRSSDQGDSWKKIPAASALNQPPYYPTFGLAAGCCNSGVLIDPVQPKRLFILAGFGVLRTDDITQDNPVWTWVMKNLEELVVDTVKAPPVVNVPGTNEPGADLLSGVADMMGFRHASRDVVPAATFPSFDYVAQATSIAYSAAHPENSAFVGWDHPTLKVKTGITTDNGKTWKPFADSSPGVAGNIAMGTANPRNLVWAPVRPSPVVYSLDGGATWKPSRLDSGAPLPLSWQIGNVWWNPQVLVADMVLPSTFYYFANGDFYSSSDGGATWAKKSVLDNAGGSVLYTINVSIVPHPLKAGDLWVTFARNRNIANPFRLMHSTDGGARFAPVASLASCNFIAFGKGNQADQPFIYAHGRKNSTDLDTIYKSEDGAATWIPVSDPARMQFGSILNLEADMRTRDLVYVATGGRGILYGYGPGSGLAGPDIPPSAVADAASLSSGPVSPGEMIVISAKDIGSPAEIAWSFDEAGSVSSTVSGVRVAFDGVSAPLMKASADQLSVMVPFAVSGRDYTNMEVTSGNRTSPPVTLPVGPANPAIFTADGSGKGQALAVLNSNGKSNTAAALAQAGEVLSLWLNGAGLLKGSLADGSAVTQAIPLAASVKVTVGGVPAKVEYCGSAPGAVAGIVRLDIRVPDGVHGTEVPVVATIGESRSTPEVTLALQ